jgi:hypothetical protein
LKAARKEQVVIFHDDQVLSGWLSRASHLTDPLLYVVYHCNLSDPARPDSLIPSNRPFFDQSALLPEAPDVPVVIPGVSLQVYPVKVVSVLNSGLLRRAMN